MEPFVEYVDVEPYDTPQFRNFFLRRPGQSKHSLECTLPRLDQMLSNSRRQCVRLTIVRSQCRFR